MYPPASIAHGFAFLPRLLRRQNGSTLVEFALAFPLFMLFFMFVAEYGLMMFGNAVIRNMTEQAARASMVGCLNAEFTDDTTCRAQDVYDLNRLKAEIRSRSLGLVKADNQELFSFTAGPMSDYASGRYAGDGSVDLGQGSEIRVFRTAYEWPVMFPLLSHLGFFQNTVRFETITVARNEPFGNINNRE